MYLLVIFGVASLVLGTMNWPELAPAAQDRTRMQ